MGEKVQLEIELKAAQALAEIKRMSKELSALADEARALGPSTDSVKSTLGNLASTLREDAEMAKLFGKSSEGLRAQQSSIKNAARELVAQGLGPESAELTNLKQQYGAVSKELKNFESGQQKASSQSQGMVRTLGALAVSLGLTMAAFTGIKSSVTYLGNMEQTLTAMTVKLGSASQATALLAQEKALANQTPLEFKDISSAGDMLLSYGTQAGQLVDTVKMLGNVSAGVRAPLQDIAYLYGTLQTQGKAQLEDIKQFAGRGIPIYEELAKVMGVNKSQVAALVSEGKVGFPEIQKAFVAMTAEGGRYAGMMAAQAQTFQGRLSTLKDALAESGGKAFGASFEVLKQGIEEAGKALTQVQPQIEVLGAVLGTGLSLGLKVLVSIKDILFSIPEPAYKIGAAFAAIAIAAVEFNRLKIAIEGVKAGTIAAKGIMILFSAEARAAAVQSALSFLATAGVIVAIVAAVAAVIFLAVSLAKEWDRVKEAAGVMADGMKTIFGALGVFITEPFVYLGKIVQITFDTIIKIVGFSMAKILEGIILPMNLVIKGLNAIGVNVSEIKLPKELQDLSKKGVKGILADTGADIKAASTASANKLAQAGKDLAAGASTLWQGTKQMGGAILDGMKESVDDVAKMLGIKSKEEIQKELASTDVVIPVVPQPTEQPKPEAVKAFADFGSSLNVEPITLADQAMAKLSLATKEYAQNLQKADELGAAAGAGTREINAVKMKSLAVYSAAQEKALTEYAQKSREIDVSLTETQIDDLELQRDRELASFAGTEEQKALLAASWAKKITETEKAEAEKAAADRVAAMKEAFTRMKEMAASSGNWGAYAGAEFQSQAAGTDIGRIAGLAGNAGEDPMKLLIAAAVTLALSFDSVNKALNFIQTFVGDLKPILDPLVGDALKPLLQNIKDLATPFSQILAPFISLVALMFRLNPNFELMRIGAQLIGDGFVWLNDEIIVPFGNFVINILNSIIRGVNTFLTNMGVPSRFLLRQIELMQTTTEFATQSARTAEAQEKIADAMDDVREVFQKRLEDLKQAYDDNIGALSNLLELGVISEEEYAQRVRAYNWEYELQQEVLELERDRQITALQELSDALEDGTISVAAAMAQLDAALRSIGVGTKGSGTKGSGTKGSGTGTTAGVLTDGPTPPSTGNPGPILGPGGVHPVSSAIANREMSLGGSGAQAQWNGAANITVQVTVQGSVTAEDDLADSIASRVERRLGRGQLEL
jgi:tape measure domain-containing protein